MSPFLRLLCTPCPAIETEVLRREYQRVVVEPHPGPCWAAASALAIDAAAVILYHDMRADPEPGSAVQLSCALLNASSSRDPREVTRPRIYPGQAPSLDTGPDRPFSGEHQPHLRSERSR